jgi:hypothetical protein
MFQAYDAMLQYTGLKGEKYVRRNLPHNNSPLTGIKIKPYFYHGTSKNTNIETFLFHKKNP